MDDTAANRLLYILQVATASFPTGAFNHSYGFETWIDSGEINDASSFETACRDWLVYTVAPADGVAVAHAHTAASTCDVEALVSLDHVVGALKLSRETREASVKTGRAFLNAIRDVFDPPGLTGYMDAVRGGLCEGHHAIGFGAAASIFGLARDEAVLLYLQAACSNLAAVASRLIPLGQVETQRIIRRAWPLLTLAAQEASNSELARIGTSMVALDVASMRHENLHTRLCMS